MGMAGMTPPWTRVASVIWLNKRKHEFILSDYKLSTQVQRDLAWPQLF